MGARDALHWATIGRRELALRSRALVSSLAATSKSVCADRIELRRLAESQGALRHVATLVARGVSPPEAFRTVAGELGSLIGADYTAINRYESDQTATVVAHWSDPHVPDALAPLGGRWPIAADTAAALVLRTGKATRITGDSIRSEIGTWIRSNKISHIVSCPVWVEGRLWGETAVMFCGPEPPPADTEERLGDFVELVACTIAQAKSRADLIDSRARVIAASDATRRRIERDLHDGVQQHLVSIGYNLRSAEGVASQDELKQALSGAADDLSGVLSELQEISRGLHPAVLSKSGLDAALKTLARRSPVPVELHDQAPNPLPEQVQVAIFYVVSEALTNAYKHAEASTVHVDLAAADGEVHLTIHDDGHGGAEFGQGSGLIGLKDRVEALSGTLRLASPTGVGTSLDVTIPVEAA
ncbi:histidine kinase [Actinomadura sp. DC4]|uniref:GAF domain-containing sensor histidine kinase n=1 Tax=Actinomadura sp. DC4 TaxID=3055069 RepID=UPI0025B1A73A|nr:histidine kinase [Actinomadura sp. DC4]MDN3354228.1 histidine kinase [Actinomadura sp. DC4]